MTTADVAITDGTVEITSGLYDTDDGYKAKVAGDAYPRIHITPQGEVKTGDGTGAPTALTAGSNEQTATAIVANEDFTVGTFTTVDILNASGDVVVNNLARASVVGIKVAVWSGDNGGNVFTITASGPCTLVHAFLGGESVNIPAAAGDNNVILLATNTSGPDGVTAEGEAATGFAWVNSTPIINYEDLVHVPNRFMTLTTYGTHIGGGTQDNVADWLVTPAEGTISDPGTDWDGLDYYRIAAYDEGPITLDTIDTSDEVTAAPGSFTGVEVGDAIYGVTGIADGTTITALTDPNDGPATLSAAATATGTDSGTVRFPALDGARVPYDANGVARAIDQADPTLNGTFEVFSDSHGVTGLYAVRTVWWNGALNDSISPLTVKVGTPWIIGAGNNHVDEIWMAGDGMDSNSTPIKIKAENVKVDGDTIGGVLTGVDNLHDALVAIEAAL